MIRLSACYRLLKDIIRNNKAIWKELYKRDFLSGAYRKEEWEFTFWCVRTDPNITTMLTRRTDVIKKCGLV
jgi:hypothetical protein